MARLHGGCTQYISIPRRAYSPGCCTCGGRSIGQLTGISKRWLSSASIRRIASGLPRPRPCFVEIMEMEIRLLRESDLPAALRLKELAQWNQTEDDWLRLLRLEPNGCFCGTIEGDVVATTTTTTYGSVLAWVGMVLVDPEHRRRGIATKLMQVAMDYLSKAGVETIKLDATPAGRSVYENLGFKEESLIERWEGVASSQRVERSPLDAMVRSEALDLDRHGFGADRAKLIGMLFDESSVEPVVEKNTCGDFKG